MSLGSIVLNQLTKNFKGEPLQRELLEFVHDRRGFGIGILSGKPFDAKIEGHIFTYCPATKTVIRKESTK